MADLPEQCLERALGGLDRLQHLLVVTGAGISLASGIPTFRGTDAGAIWSHDVTELGTLRYFLRDPVGSWKWYLERFSRLLGAKPNDAHRSLVDLERWHQSRGGRFLLVTQNIDSLHELAGTVSLVKVHGSADRLRCVRQGCRWGAPCGFISHHEVDLARFLADPCERHLPRCASCTSLLRPHVLWFDETYDSHADYQMAAVEAAIGATHLVLFVGTSFSVGVTELALQGAYWRGVPMLSIDPAGRPPSMVTSLPAPAEELLPLVCAAIGAGVAASEPG